MNHKIIDAFNPNKKGEKESLFGIPSTVSDASIILIPVPWEVTVSYHSGTAQAPQQIRSSSLQVDLCQLDISNACKAGFHMIDDSENLAVSNQKLRDLAGKLISSFDGKCSISKPLQLEMLEKVNKGCEQMIWKIFELSLDFLKKDKIVGIVGGDHSSPLGLIRAIGSVHSSFGVLQIDAHADLRPEYQGFKYSHASIMHHIINQSFVEKLVQVGVRDLCEQEAEEIYTNSKISCFSQHNLDNSSFSGKTWKRQCEEIVGLLPKKVYVSFDIDGLDPSLCPGTGTPVPGGLSYQQVDFLFTSVVHSGRSIIGFDLCEVARVPDSDWDTNVAARLLYRLCSLSAASIGALSLKKLN